jgi:hypothetical protein
MTASANQNRSESESRAEYMHVERAAKALGLIETVRSVAVKGCHHTTAEQVLEIAEIEEGGSYNPHNFSRQISLLKSTGFFSKVDVHGSNGDIEILVEENPIIERILYEGRRLDIFESVENHLYSRPGMIFSRDKVLYDIYLIIRSFMDEDIINVDIVPKLITLPFGKVDLVFEEFCDENDILNYDYIETEYHDSRVTLKFNKSIFIKEGISDLVSEPLNRALHLANYPESERDGFISDTISRIIDHRSASVTTSDGHLVKDAQKVQAQQRPPETAPIKWKDREPGETAPDFARRVYGPWLQDGMSKRVLRKLDVALVNELNTWVRNGNEMPGDINLLTVKEENDRLLGEDPTAIREHLGKFTAEEAIREVTRLRSAQQRRK